MIWNCGDSVKEIKFKYSNLLKEHRCCIKGYVYAWEASFRNAGPWDWLKDGYTKKLAEWV